MIGKTLQNGKYEIKRILGQGGFGITYEGVQTGLGRKVAIKEFFMKDFCEREEGTSMVTIVGTEGNRSLVERFKEKFIKEAQMIAGLEDVPHVIRIYDIFQENGTAYYVMQYIEGGSLDSKVKTEGALSESETIGYIMQIADALDHLHAQRIMHLDIKPANILLRGNDLFLIDFGVSKHYDAEGDATTTTPVGRSKGYAPIEQYRQGGVQSFSPETDIYSLGATAYYLVTGKTPPEATELVIDSLVRPDNISNSLWKTLKASMRSNKKDRPHSIMEFRSFLNEQQKEDVTIRTDEKNETNDDTIICGLPSQKNSKEKRGKGEFSLKKLPPFAWFILLVCGAGCILAACLTLSYFFKNTEYIKSDPYYYITMLITGISSCVIYIYGNVALKLKYDNAIPLISAFLLSNLIVPIEILFNSIFDGLIGSQIIFIFAIILVLIFVIYLNKSQKVVRLFPKEKRKLFLIDNFIILGYSSFFMLGIQNNGWTNNGWNVIKAFVLLEMLIYSPWLFGKIKNTLKSNDSQMANVRNY